MNNNFVEIKLEGDYYYKNFHLSKKYKKCWKLYEKAHQQFYMVQDSKPHPVVFSQTQSLRDLKLFVRALCYEDYCYKPIIVTEGKIEITPETIVEI